jgi:signal peptidase I
MPDTATAPNTNAKPDATKGKKKDNHPRDPAREVIETIVFVVVLVLLLKLFVTEAFVIPTGSMAETLYGYQKIVTCPECGHEFPVNSHDEVEPGQDKQYHQLSGCTCPNCRYSISFPLVPGATVPRYASPPNRTGDRVLVLKPLYHIRRPTRGDVVVFKYPKAPQENWIAANYIKRCMAFGGETLAIHRGELFVTQSLTYPEGDEQYPRPEDPKDLWETRYTYFNNPKATELFETSRAAGFTDQIVGGFQIIRKTDEQVLACRRIVWDNDKQPRSLAGKVPSRWYAPAAAQGKWTADSVQQPRVFDHTTDSLDWIRYRHLCWVLDPHTKTLRPWSWSDNAEPVVGPIDNFLAYNTGTWDGNPNPRDAAGAEKLWVGDLILECEAVIGNGGEVTLELSKGLNRFQAKFAGGHVTLTRTGPGETEFGSWPCKVNGAGKYRLRFANVDCRLRVWVNDSLVPVGTATDYPHPEPGPNDEVEPEGWTKTNDLEAPASIGAKGAVKVSAVKLFRDIYYTRSQSAPSEDRDRERDREVRGTYHRGADIYYVHPGHYMCLGDNSAQSSDSRSWGMVPERLMLGKAVFVFWPLFPSPNRVGFIK